MKYFILGITIVSLLGIVLLLSGCVKNDGWCVKDDNTKCSAKSELTKDEKELDKCLLELNVDEVLEPDEVSEDLESLDDNSSLSTDETSMDSDLTELETISDDDITTDLESLEDLN